MTHENIHSTLKGGNPHEDSKTHQKRFDELAAGFKRSELTRQNEDGSRTDIVAYRRYIDPLNRHEMTAVEEFRMRAAAAGMKEVFAPLVLPTHQTLFGRQEYVAIEAEPRTPLTFVQFGYERPSTT